MPVERASGGSSLIDVLDRVLDKGIVIDAWVRVSLVGIDVITVEARECAQGAVDWLAEAGAGRAICALSDGETGKVKDVLARGVPDSQLRGLTIALEDPQDPLVFALAGPEPVPLSAKRRRPAIFGRDDLLALPLPVSEKREARLGLLLVSLAGGELEAQARWAAELLGQKLSRLRSQTALLEGEHRLARERELLLSIINASPDPILLTDTEGRMIISNARADALFSAKDGESEGRHRAVALNNMLFSATLSQQAIDESGAARPH